MSSKRILPALILAGTVGFLGLHRIYAGRIISGLAQLILFTTGAAMLWRSMSGWESLQTLDQVEAWLVEHPVPLLPVLLVAAPTFWALFDCALILGRNFRDGAGNKISRWL